MEANLYEVLERIANALEKQNQLLENKEKRAIRLDVLESKLKKIQIQESKSPRNSDEA